MKKLLALALMLCLVLGLAPGAAAAGTEAEDAAGALYALGLFRGTGTDAEGAPTFELGRALTRSEAVTMLVRLMGREQEALDGSWQTPFTDVAAWARPAVEFCLRTGTLTTDGSGRFLPGDTITREEAAEALEAFALYVEANQAR